MLGTSCGYRLSCPICSNNDNCVAIKLTVFGLVCGFWSWACPEAHLVSTDLLATNPDWKGHEEKNWKQRAHIHQSNMAGTMKADNRRKGARSGAYHAMLAMDQQLTSVTGQRF